jgi:23S rRNA pseudouridine1911/1915/1917 synthase
MAENNTKYNIHNRNFITPKIIYEDDSILVLDKPSGWITNSATTTTNQPVVEDWLMETFKFDIFDFKLMRHGIVHRLDKETSGIILVAKTDKAFIELQRQFKERIVKKTYTALVHGNIKPPVGTIKTTVGRLPWRRDRFGIIPGGRESETDYKVIASYEMAKTNKPHLKSYSLTEFYPKTGRTHQIRIHAKHIGHPLVSDEFYAGRKTARDDRRWCPRLFLHASEISFTHPEKKEKAVFSSPFSEDLIIALGKLQKI